MYNYEATVERVVDGDTIDLIIDLGMSVYHKVRVRLYGIDTPEVYGVKRDSEEYARGLRASERVKSLLQEGDRVRVRTFKDKTGKFGRYLVVLFFVFGGRWKNLNQMLVDEGYATPLAARPADADGTDKPPSF